MSHAMTFSQGLSESELGPPVIMHALPHSMTLLKMRAWVEPPVFSCTEERA